MVNILDILPALFGMTAVGSLFICFYRDFENSRKKIVIASFIFIISGFIAQKAYNFNMTHGDVFRGWVTIILSSCAFCIAYFTYLKNQKQRKLENSFKLITLFKESLQKDDIEMWENIFVASSESVGAKKGFFVMYNSIYTHEFPERITKQKPHLMKPEIFHEIVAIEENEEIKHLELFPFSQLFSECPHDKGAIQRMAELFDLISYQILNQTVDEKLIYFELGQLMDTIKLWLSFIDNPYSNKSFFQENFPSLYELHERGIIQYSWKRKTYARIE